MAAFRREPKQSWFVSNSGGALFLAGFTMLLFAFVVLLLEKNGGVATALIVLGTAVILIGGLLPRLSGIIKITPTSIELSLAERLEATRQVAAERAPESVQEAVGRAFEELVPQLQARGLLPEAATAQGSAEATAGHSLARTELESRTATRKMARSFSAWRKALAVASLVVVGAVLGISLFAMARTIEDAQTALEPPAVEVELREELPVDSGGDEAPPTQPPLLSERQTAPVLVAVALGLSLLAVLLAWLWVVRRRRIANATEHLPPLEPPAVFAQRIVDDIAGPTTT